jgi:hypothetical protein
MNEKEKLKVAKKEYLSNSNISCFIDLLVKQTVDNIECKLLVGYTTEFIELIINEFWVTGRAIFDYPCKSCEQIIKLYDPEYVKIGYTRNSPRCKIIYCGEDITDKALFIARREDSFDWFGTSIIEPNSRISSFGLEDFNTALRNAVKYANGTFQV